MHACILDSTSLALFLNEAPWNQFELEQLHQVGELTSQFVRPHICWLFIWQNVAVFFQVDRWPSNGYVKKLKLRNGHFYYYNQTRECANKDIHRTKLYAYWFPCQWRQRMSDATELYCTCLHDFMHQSEQIHFLSRSPANYHCLLIATFCANKNFYVSELSFLLNCLSVNLFTCNT